MRKRDRERMHRALDKLIEFKEAWGFAEYQWERHHPCPVCEANGQCAEEDRLMRATFKAENRYEDAAASFTYRLGV